MVASHQVKECLAKLEEAEQKRVQLQKQVHSTSLYMNMVLFRWYKALVYVAHWRKVHCSTLLLLLARAKQNHVYAQRMLLNNKRAEEYFARIQLSAGGPLQRKRGVFS
jgi:hypothetical protein